jgi:putative ABC transport system permease protein
MSRLARFLPLVLRPLQRRPAATLLTLGGIAIATFLLVAVRAIDAGVREATVAGPDDRTLIVYRANRFCPFTSRLPQHYTARIAAMPGVESAIPMRITVSNCRASLDVVTFRGVPAGEFRASIAPSLELVAGSLDEWERRGDAAIVGEALAARRGLAVGDRFTAAGLSVTVAGIAGSDLPQDRNAAFVHLPFLQEAAEAGGTGGEVTQFAVTVDDASRLEAIAAAIDAEFARDSAPTSTRAEKAFVARAAADLVELARFANWLGLGALVAVFALVANAIAASIADRSRDLAILQALGFRPGLVTSLVVAEGALLGLAGGAIGAGAAFATLRLGRFGLTTEGLTIEFDAGPGPLLIGLLAAIAAGAFASLLPAARAGSRDIVPALRSA